MPDPAALPVPQGRDPRLDVFRGLALVMIYVNHVPGTIYETLTTRNFGQSDAAEAFVLMSGAAAGLAYGPAFRARPYWPGVARVWNRVWTLYLVHLFMTVWALGIASASAEWLNVTQRLYVNEINMLFTQPLGFLVGVPLMMHQLGYVNILPMYAALLGVTPALLWVAFRRPLLLWAASFGLWLATGLLEWNLPSHPNPGGWFFNPFAWQVLFVTGLLGGVAARQGRRLVPVWGWLQWTTGLVLLAGLIWAKVPAIGDPITLALWQANQDGLNRFWTYADKTYETWPRLLHILALGYFLFSFAWVRRAAASPLAEPLAVMGRNALPVFVCGSLLALAAQAMKEAAEPGLALDTALIFGGLGLQLAFAVARDRLSLKRRKPIGLQTAHAEIAAPVPAIADPRNVLRFRRR